MTMTFLPVDFFTNKYVLYKFCINNFFIYILNYSRTYSKSKSCYFFYIVDRFDQIE